MLIRTRTGQDRYMCKAFHNRIGIALAVQSILELAGGSHPNTLVGAATAQEEVGMRGAQVAGFTRDL
jgi:endoglucanase